MIVGASEETMRISPSLPALALLALLPSVGSAGAEDGTTLPPIDHAATLSECSACHMAFPPQMLPARSWQKIMGGLADHFGEDASLAEPVRADILAYLTAHAADAPGTAQGPRFLRGLGADAVPLRITQMPFWARAHDEVSAGAFSAPAVKSAANCVACHRTASKGEFVEPED
jgi:mono/diheme cytochrome c family protein